MLQIQPFTVNMIQENCYVVSDATKEAVIVDCGAYYDEEYAAIKDYIESNQLRPVRHLLTHGHFDHCFGAQWVKDTYGLAPQLCEADEATYHMQAEQLMFFLHRPLPIQLPKLGKLFKEGDTIGFGTHTFHVISTPGHTPGGVCLYEQEEHELFSGDNLFRGSIGRCDLPGSDPVALPQALKKKIIILPEETRVWPGHGPETTIGFERNNNPYI